MTIRLAAFSLRIEPCSMEATPARVAAMIPAVPWACAATLRPWRAASSTAASSSASEYCWASPDSVKEATPAVAQILMSLAPCLA